MYRIRFHGRGGQGMKTASRILGTAFFQNGYEVQDAPRYGAERRGAPIFAYVRAGHHPINARGSIRRPDLIIVADDSLVGIPAAGVLAGVITERTILLINSTESTGTWRHRLNFPGPILILPAEPPAENETADRATMPYIGTACAAAAARLTGVISLNVLEQAVAEELQALGKDVINANIARARKAWNEMNEYAGLLRETDEPGLKEYGKPDWIDVPFETASVAAPDIFDALTSVEVNTGLWRTMRPVVDYDRCNRCWWICSTFCPDGAISVNTENYPVIDYDHCKGCLICTAKCPPHAISAIPEQEARAEAES